MQRGIGKFKDVVRRNGGRHANGDALRTVSKQVRNPCRQQARLFGFTVIGRPEIDRILIDAVEKTLRHLGHPRFGIAHGGGVIAVDIAKIALPVDKSVAHREFLRQPYHRVIDRRIAMRVEFTHDIANNPC